MLLKLALYGYLEMTSPLTGLFIIRSINGLVVLRRPRTAILVLQNDYFNFSNV